MVRQAGAVTCHCTKGGSWNWRTGGEAGKAVFFLSSISATIHNKQLV